jgi:hypothetical protein
MPTMIPLSGKAKKIKEKILGSPMNEHIAHTRDPQIREADKHRVITALMLNNMMGNQQMGPMGPQNDMGMM